MQAKPDELAKEVAKQLYELDKNKTVWPEIVSQLTKAFLNQDWESFSQVAVKYQFDQFKAAIIFDRYRQYFLPTQQPLLAPTRIPPIRVGPNTEQQPKVFNPFEDEIVPIPPPQGQFSVPAFNPFESVAPGPNPIQPSAPAQIVKAPAAPYVPNLPPQTKPYPVRQPPIPVVEPERPKAAPPKSQPPNPAAHVHQTKPEVSATHVGSSPATVHTMHGLPTLALTVASVAAPEGIQAGTRPRRATNYSSTAESYHLIDSKRDVGDNSAIFKPELNWPTYKKFSDNLSNQQVQVFCFYGDPDRFVPEAQAFLEANAPSTYRRKTEEGQVSIEAWVRGPRVAFVLNTHPHLFGSVLKDAGLAIDFTRYLLDFCDQLYLATPSSFHYKPPKSQRQHILDMSFTSMEAVKLEASEKIGIENISIDEAAFSGDFTIHQNNSNRLIQLKRTGTSNLDQHLDGLVSSLWDLCTANKPDTKKLQELLSGEWTVLVPEAGRKDWLARTGEAVKGADGKGGNGAGTKGASAGKGGNMMDEDEEMEMDTSMAAGGEKSAPKSSSSSKSKNPLLTRALTRVASKKKASPSALFTKLSNLLLEFCEDPKPSEHIELTFLYAGLTVEGTKVAGCKVNTDKLSLAKKFEGKDLDINGFWVRPSDGSGAFLLAGCPDPKSSTLFHFTGKPSIQSSLKEVKRFKSAETKIYFNDSKEMYCAYNMGQKAEIGQINSLGRLDRVRDISCIYKYEPEPDEEAEDTTIQEILSLAICERNSRIYFLDERHELYEFAIDDTKSIRVQHPEDAGKNRKIKPSKGGKYEKIGTPSAGKLIFLANSVTIDVYDLNFVRLASINDNHAPDFCSFLQGSSHYLLYKDHSDRVRCTAINGVEDSIIHKFSDELDSSGRKKEADPDDSANTVLDIVLRAATKFGTPASQGGFPEVVHVFLDCDPSQAQQAQKHMSDPKYSMLKTDVVGSNAYINYQVAKQKSTEELKRTILSRISIHVASIQQYNLVPLFDGKFDMDEVSKLLRGDEKKSSVSKLIEAVTFGHIEHLIQKWDGNLNVVSIVGRQSSGKSYILNRLFGTRFNVAAERCTDGIWMSVGFYKPQGAQSTRLIVVMDCEGLFSVARSASEEMKMCLALASVTDAFIANQDLSFNRNLSAMIESLTRGVGKLKGDKLFKGRLAFFMRDVSNNAVEFDGARREFKNNLAKIVSSENSFLFKLFERKAENHTFVHFEDPEFPKLIEMAKERLLNGMDTRRWSNGGDFLRAFKGVLAQLTVDDDLDLEEHTNKNQTEMALKKVVEIFLLIPEGLNFGSSSIEGMLTYRITKTYQTHDSGSDSDEDEPAPLVPTLDHRRITLEDHVEVFVDETGIVAKVDPTVLAEFDDNLLETFPYPNLLQAVTNFVGEYRVEKHDQFVGYLSFLLAEFFKSKQNVLLAYYDHLTGDTKKAKSKSSKRSTNTTLDWQRESINNLVQTARLLCTFCDRTCVDCKRSCVKRFGHPDDCNCSTNHKCGKICTVNQKCKASRKKCALKYGHTSTHTCADGEHVCGGRCKFPDCPDPCRLEIKHKGYHNCSGFHKCTERCGKSNCTKTCVESADDPHEKHHCSAKTCTELCKLCPQPTQCCEQNHFHAEDLVRGKPCKHDYHTCGQIHKCRNSCQIPGVCYVDYKPIEMTIPSETGEIKFTYFEAIQLRHDCSKVIPEAKEKHASTCACETKLHRCHIACPDCKGLCEKPAGHVGLHSSSKHRNKDMNVFATTERDHKIVIQAEKSKRVYKAGDNCEPETCSDACQRKFRSHFHLIECPGEAHCPSKTNPRVTHSTQKYFPNTSVVYDEWLCGDYWAHHNWQPPVSPEVAAENAMCNFYCLICHKNKEARPTVFCVHAAKHTGDHELSCGHVSGSGNYQVCFLMDTTGSMGGYITQSKATITNIINQFNTLGKGAKIEFAFVAYKDHCDPQVTFVQPFTESAGMITYIQGLSASGGGDMPEAVLDGMDEVAKLPWKRDTNNYVFHIADAPPHGKRFTSSGDSYPAGCPCKLELEPVAARIVAHQIKYYLLKIGSYVNTFDTEAARVLTPYTSSAITSPPKMDEMITAVLVAELKNDEIDINIGKKKS